MRPRWGRGGGAGRSPGGEWRKRKLATSQEPQAPTTAAGRAAPLPNTDEAW